MSAIRARRLAAAGLVAALVAGAAPALGQTVSYPPSRSLGDIATWLQKDTPISLSQVVDVGPSAVTAVTSAAPMGQPRGFLANVASEALDPQIAGRESIAAWSIPVEIDCDKHAVRLGVMTGFRSRDLVSEPRIVRQADSDWVTPTSSAPLGAVARALCDRDFHRPFAGRTRLAARAPKAAPPVAAAPTPVLPPADAAVATAPRLPTLRTTPAPEPAEAPARTARPKSAETKTAEAGAPKAKPPAGGGVIAVQIGASPSLPDLQRLLDKAKKKFAGDLGGLTAKAATVQVEGKTVNRALISGFASNAEANAFCKKLSAEGQACFIRR
ncbi:MAG TPA: SPOR domain-containing protein [Phenylobacterium sp.]|uniref:SPOR domain-containing protein n=1 Tax=Phenylobacterium sp. TaxID=1871053 RepID=UPI002D65EF05|nr:SPOR domain-containing protein [Phenylobacterium sp.]HZZ68607.1 SPOR domain-containing protein [Phenylobacterium sp.]